MAQEENRVYREQIKAVIPFQFLTEEELDEMLTISEIRIYQEGETIIEEQEVGEDLFAVLDGTVSVTVHNSKGAEIYLNSIGAGQIFGETAIFLKVKRTACITSASSSVILKIGRHPMLDFIKKYPTGGIKILMLIIYGLLKKLKASNDELAFERQEDLVQTDIDSFINDFIKNE